MADRPRRNQSSPWINLPVIVTFGLVGALFDELALGRLAYEDA